MKQMMKKIDRDCNRHDLYMKIVTRAHFTTDYQISC